MKVEPISVSGSYEYMDSFGMKRWKKISIGATVTEDEDVIQCLTELDKKVEDAYKKISKELEIVADNAPLPVINIEKIDYEKDIEQIRKCTTIAGIESLRTYVKGKPILEAELFLVQKKLLKNGAK